MTRKVIREWDINPPTYRKTRKDEKPNPEKFIIINMPPKLVQCISCKAWMYDTQNHCAFHVNTRTTSTKNNRPQPA